MSKAERTRQFIIEASAPIINKKGMAGTSLSDIMEATKLAKGGIYGLKGFALIYFCWFFKFFSSYDKPDRF